VGLGVGEAGAEPAVHRPRSAGHIAGLIGGQKSHDTRDLLGLADAPERMLLAHQTLGLVPIGRVLEPLEHQPGPHEARAHGVDADAVPAELERHAAREPDQPCDWRQAHPTVATTLGWASGVIGSLLAGEVVHQLTGVSEPATTGTAITIDLRTLHVTRERVERDPACPVCSALV
jgi:hypothetical protein